MPDWTRFSCHHDSPEYPLLEGIHDKNNVSYAGYNNIGPCNTGCSQRTKDVVEVLDVFLRNRSLKIVSPINSFFVDSLVQLEFLILTEKHSNLSVLFCANDAEVENLNDIRLNTPAELNIFHVFHGVHDSNSLIKVVIAKNIEATILKVSEDLSGLDVSNIFSCLKEATTLFLEDGILEVGTGKDNLLEIIGYLYLILIWNFSVKVEDHDGL